MNNETKAIPANEAQEPTVGFLVELAAALRTAKHKAVAESITAGLLYALYPEWFSEHEPYFGKTGEVKAGAVEDALRREYANTFGNKDARL